MLRFFIMWYNPGMEETCMIYSLEVTRGVADKRELWMPGQKLRIYFFDGSSVTRARVLASAAGWMLCANIRFVLSPSPEESDIRITFAHGGNWSYIGRVAERVPRDRPTMALRISDTTPDGEVKRLALHEFGHALGLLHEHQNPLGGIQWNRDAAYQFYQRLNGWSRDDVDRNVFEAYRLDYANGLILAEPFDPASIMLYPIPSELTTNGFSVGWNRELSAGDIAIAHHLYPATPPPPPVHPGGLGVGLAARALTVVRVRQQPGLAGQVIGRLTPGQSIAIVGGPRLASGLRWWQIAQPAGWVAEAAGGNRLIG